MKVILYKNIRENHLSQLKQLLDGLTLKPFDEQPLNDEVVMIIIGEEGNDLIPAIQKINKKDPDLSIIILPTNPFMINHLKAAIQFSPFIGHNVKMVSSISQPDLQKIINEQSELTTTRRKFKKTKDRSLNQLIDAFKLDSSLKSKFLDKFLAQAPVGVILLDQDNLVLDMNNYAVKFIPKLAKHKLKKASDLFSKNRKKLEKFLNHRHSENESIILEVNDINQAPNYGRFFHSHINSSSSTFNILIFLDITKEKIIEEKNEEYLKELENHNKELEQFANIVTHDLKNPLTTITLSCEMGEGGSAEEKDHYLKIIQRSAKNLLQMLEGLEVMIDVRRDNKKHTEKLNFEKVLDDVLNEFQYQIKSHGIEITRNFKKKNIIFIGSYLFSILHNIISNAIKYSRSNVPLKINIETEKAGHYILLKISDNGIGIDLDVHRNNLFKPFRRLTQQAEGKGIGLNLIKSMIEKNGGKIDVESTPGEGTTFLCYICPFRS